MFPSGRCWLPIASLRPFAKAPEYFSTVTPISATRSAARRPWRCCVSSNAITCSRTSGKWGRGWGAACDSDLGTTSIWATFAGAAFSGRSSLWPTGQQKSLSNRSRQLHARVKRAAMARGLMVYPMGGTIDGTRGDHVLVAPPFIVDEAVIDTIVDRLGEAIEASTTRT